MFRSSQTLTKKAPSKLIMGFAVVAATAVVGASGVVHAAQTNRSPNAPNPSSKAACKNGGWKHYQFKSQADCLSWWDNRPSSGYGGGSNVNVSNNTNVNLEVNGSRNVITVIIYNVTNFFN